MRILLTGGTGFIGKNLYEGLCKRHKIFAPARQELDLFNWQAIEAYIISNKIDVIIHTAVGKGDSVLSDTLRMFFAILKNADKVKKIIHLGSGAEYAKTRDLIKVKEKDFGKYIPVDDYGFAKYICSKTVQNNKKVITLRLFGIYGKYESPLMKFISNSIAKNLVNMPITIKQNVIFDYLCVDDLLPVVEYVVGHKMKHQFYNVTPTKSISLSQIANIINQISNKKSKVNIANKGLNFQYTGHNGQLLKEIRSLKFHSYEFGIRQLFNYYKNNKSSLDIKKIKEDIFFKIKDIKR